MSDLAENSDSSNPDAESIRETGRWWTRRLLAFVLTCLIRLLSMTFLRVNQFYGACVGHVLYLFAGKTKRIARANLEIAFPDLSADQRENLLKSHLIELGKTIAELGPIWSWGKRRTSNLIVDIQGENHVDEALSHGRGVIVLVPHFGAWELGGLHLSIQYGVVSLYRPPRLSGIAEFVRNARQRFGAKLVPTDLSGVRAVRTALKQNRMVGILPDQDPGEEGSVRAPFFGRSARTMVLVSRLVAKSKCKVVYLASERLPKGAGYRLHFLPAAEAIASGDELAAATALNHGVESVINLAPAQYLWSYRRFRGRVDGKADPYKRSDVQDAPRRAA
jgi:KDO2-lipid IV(A) lauroyltransferase